MKRYYPKADLCIHPDYVIALFLEINNRWFDDKTNSFSGIKEACRFALAAYVEGKELYGSGLSELNRDYMIRKFDEWIDGSFDVREEN